jgi:hypothetical protein
MRKFVFIEPQQHKLVTSICESAGIEDPGTIRRLVIDLRYGEPGRIYVEQFGDEAILDVDIATLGIFAREDPDDAHDGYVAHRAGPGGALTYRELEQKITDSWQMKASIGARLKHLMGRTA